MTATCVRDAKQISYELFGEKLRLIQQCFSETQPGIEKHRFYSKRPSKVELAMSLADYIDWSPNSNLIPGKDFKAIRRSFERCWHKYYKLKVPANEFMKFPERDPYKLVVVPGKGRGLIASRDLKGGEKILEESPMVTLPQNYDIGLLFLLPQQALEAVFMLHNEIPDFCYNRWLDRSPYTRLSKYLRGIINSNICRVLDINDSPRMVLPMTGSLFNHDNKPNTCRKWNKRGEKMLFKIIRDVKMGEELVIDYCPPSTVRCNIDRDVILRSRGLWSGTVTEGGLEWVRGTKCGYEEVN
ncbi:uncharacterized protein RSE6_09116 [Rhynchosporium secalis]|uniref:SET domain-containing protein n=1 Tax=Rhynchosporium secalis TaxID=38038 RepID=A0A1E1MH36_RHYSE|nr:uncharacterized protein RSE6_09116 [Rhynchosporium secalis]